ncbi:MAG: EB domain-containing protein, partial [Patescibacteria group bacterium]
SSPSPLPLKSVQAGSTHVVEWDVNQGDGTANFGVQFAAPKICSDFSFDPYTVQTCTSDAQCSGGATCTQGICSDSPSIRTCTSDSQCAAGATCLDVIDDSSIQLTVTPQTNTSKQRITWDGTAFNWYASGTQTELLPLGGVKLEDFLDRIFLPGRGYGPSNSSCDWINGTNTTGWNPYPAWPWSWLGTQNLSCTCQDNNNNQSLDFFKPKFKDGTWSNIYLQMQQPFGPDGSGLAHPVKVRLEFTTKPLP